MLHLYYLNYLYSTSYDDITNEYDNAKMLRTHTLAQNGSCCFQVFESLLSFCLLLYARLSKMDIKIDNATWLVNKSFF